VPKTASNVYEQKTPLFVYLIEEYGEGCRAAKKGFEVYVLFPDTIVCKN
jgi:hypothetical protein